MGNHGGKHKNQPEQRKLPRWVKHQPDEQSEFEQHRTAGDFRKVAGGNPQINGQHGDAAQHQRDDKGHVHGQRRTAEQNSTRAHQTDQMNGPEHDNQPATTGKIPEPRLTCFSFSPDHNFPEFFKRFDSNGRR